MAGLIVKTDGKPSVSVPQEIVTQGGEAINAYVERARGERDDVPLSKMSRPELEVEAHHLGIAEPDKYPNKELLLAAIEEQSANAAGGSNGS